MPLLCARLVVLAALVLAGCTHHRSLDAASPESRSHVNARAEGESALVTLDVGEEIRARGLHVAPDVTTWLDSDTGEARSVPTTSLASVRFTDRGRGVLEGIGLGTAIGFAFGTVAGLYSDDGGIIQFSPLLIGAGYGFIGLVIGYVVGNERGSRAVYAAPDAARGD
jgi:hypothetical protein